MCGPSCLIQGQNRPLQRVYAGQGLKSLHLTCSFFGHTIADTVSRWKEGRDAKEVIKDSRQFLASEHCVFLLHISGQAHCSSQAKKEARGENHTVKIYNGL